MISVRMMMRSPGFDYPNQAGTFVIGCYEDVLTLDDTCFS